MIHTGLLVDWSNAGAWIGKIGPTPRQKYSRRYLRYPAPLSTYTPQTDLAPSEPFHQVPRPPSGPLKSEPVKPFFSGQLKNTRFKYSISQKSAENNGRLLALEALSRPSFFGGSATRSKWRSSLKTHPMRSFFYTDDLYYGNSSKIPLWNRRPGGYPPHRPEEVREGIPPIH
jgi:hypothetical protein